MAQLTLGLPRVQWGAKERRLVNSFILANLCDLVITRVALYLPGFTEKGIAAGSLLANDRWLEVLVLKVSVTAFMVGIFAWAMQRNSRWCKPIHSALRISTVIVWAVVAWNELNVILALGEMFGMAI